MKSFPALVLWPTLLAGAVAATSEDLQERLDHAARLNVTAPWQESQAILDDLMDDLDRATPRQRAQLAFLRARNLALAGEYDKASAVVADLHQPDVDTDYRLKGFRLAANIELQQDHFEQAYLHLRQALELVPQVDDAPATVNLLSLTAYFYGAAGEAEKAIATARQALAVAERSGDIRAECVALHDLSVAEEFARQIEAAIRTRTRGLAACRSASDPVHIASSQIALGRMQEQLDAAARLELIKAGVAGYAESGFRDGVFNGTIDLAELLVELGDHSQARQLVRPLVEEFERLESWRFLHHSHEILARAAEAEADFQLALAHYRAAEEAGDKLLDRDRAVRIAYLQVELDTVSKEQEIALLRERNQVLQLQEESQGQRRVLGFGGAAAMAVILVLLLLLLIRSRSDRRDLLWLSQHDGLTRLRNHTSFFRRANEALAASSAARQPFTLLVADIDYFKAVNDEHGHPAGDRALEQVGRLLEAVFGPLGVVGRIGGEEFAIALPGIARRRAHELVRELNERLQQACHGGDMIRITMSFGVAETRDDRSVEKLRQEADEALYEAKRRGRNQVVDAGKPAGARQAPAT